MTTAIVDGIVYLTDGIVSGNNIINETIAVAIFTNKADVIYENKLNVFPTPLSKGNTDPTATTPTAQSTPYSRSVDLKKITESLTILGVLENESGESAITKRENLIRLGKYRRSLTVVWGLGNYRTLWTDNPSKNEYGVFINRMQFGHEPGMIAGDSDVSNDPAPETKIKVNIQLTRGKDI